MKVSFNKKYLLFFKTTSIKVIIRKTHNKVGLKTNF